MYKVFINERKLSFTNAIQQIDKNLEFVDVNTFSIAIDLLENTSAPSVNIYAENVEEVWNTFSASFRNIEAAGGVVLNTKDEVLFIYRMSKWDLPKGKMEKGESRDLTALREVEEECSITDLSLEKFLSSTYHMYTERDGSKILKITHWYKSVTMAISSHYHRKLKVLPKPNGSYKAILKQKFSQILFRIFA
ncbi:NUDIX hydrolase [Elizabethkingia anophelis]|uniref:NUDIX hydrolase n=1 Tax=Elizabethkingia anophelis TaxID=1117645 RepID=UPI002404F446|nr:NUDIX domain-containing protein [Elizabethkingia anophelis]